MQVVRVDGALQGEVRRSASCETTREVHVAAQQIKADVREARVRALVAGCPEGAACWRARVEPEADTVAVEAEGQVSGRNAAGEVERRDRLRGVVLHADQRVLDGIKRPLRGVLVDRDRTVRVDRQQDAAARVRSDRGALIERRRGGLRSSREQEAESDTQQRDCEARTSSGP